MTFSLDEVLYGIAPILETRMHGPEELLDGSVDDLRVLERSTTSGKCYTINFDTKVIPGRYLSMKFNGR